MDNFISKHDPNAYRGKMDMLTFSNALRHLHDQTYELGLELTEAQGHELVNLRREARNEGLDEMRSIIEGLAAEYLDVNDKRNLNFNWNEGDLYEQ